MIQTKHMKKILFSVVVAAFFAVSVSAQNTSLYTSLATKDCRTIESDETGAGWYLGECKGVGGFKLRLSEGDIRQSITVVAPNGTESDLQFGRISSGFSSVGEKAEWRMKGKKPVAVILRFIYSYDPEDSSRTRSELVVAKISGSKACITDVVGPAKSQNVIARQRADTAANRPCKEFNDQ